MFVRACFLVVVGVASVSLGIAQSMPMSSQGVADPLQRGYSSQSDDPSRAGDILGSISGVVLTMDGRPVRDVSVQLHSVATGIVVSSAISSAAGTFEFRNVPVGDFEVVASRGVDQATERVHCERIETQVSLRLNIPQSEPGAGNTVSVKALSVPEKAQHEFRNAEEAFQKSRWQIAWDHVEKALSIVPNYAQAITLRGILKLDKGDQQGGKQDFQASIQSDPNYALGYIAMGAALNGEGRFNDAQRALEQGVRLDPTSWQGYLELGKTMIGKSQYREALKYVVKAESMNPPYPGIHLVKAHALIGLRIYDEAVGELERYLQLEPNGPHTDEARQSLNQARAFSATAQQ